MTSVEKLRAWADEEKRERGLVDIHFFRGTSNDVSLEEAARVVHETLTSTDFIDITDQLL
jgi:hypothetical protein